MEMIMYLIGNWCCNFAALMLVYHNRKLERKAWEQEKPEMMISRDLQIMLFIGTILRVYWSLSPPAVWSDEPYFIQWISFLDVLISPVIWLFVVVTIGLKQKKFIKTPYYMCWPFLTVVATLIGVIGIKFLPALETSTSWLYADSVVVANMILDGLAMVPQMHFIAYSEEKSTPESSHFIGLLCLGRVFRMMFWGVISAHLMYRGDAQGSYLWTFIVPDVIHTVIMGDYLYLWMKKVKRDSYDPFMQDVGFNL